MSGFHGEGHNAKQNRSGSGIGRPGCNSVRYSDRINVDQWRLADCGTYNDVLRTMILKPEPGSWVSILGMRNMSVPLGLRSIRSHRYLASHP